MFCGKCGSQIPEGVKFCGKCGAAVGPPGALERGPSMQKAKNGQRGINLPGLSPKILAAAGALAVLLLVLMVGISVGKKGKTSGGERNFTERDADAAAEKEEQNQDTDHDITALNVSSAVELEGKYKNLQSITVSPDVNGAVSAITYKEGASFPVLESLECGAVFKVSDSGTRDYFDERDFPQLRDVRMKMVNRYIDEDVLMTYMLFQEMYETGRLQSFDVENSYTIEDLYGTWSNEGRTLSLTFQQDGTLRVADANNLMGVDVLQYKETGDNTLSLSADQSGLVGMISINMEYVLFGDTLWVEFSGQSFELNRK